MRNLRLRDISATSSGHTRPINKRAGNQSHTPFLLSVIKSVLLELAEDKRSSIATLF